MTGPPKFQRRTEGARRGAFIEATLHCLAEHGHRGTTVRRIAARAGVAPGLLTHYFAGKDDLVAEAYRSLAARILDEIAHRGDTAGLTPSAGLAAFIRASFREPNLDPGLLRVWASFWNLVLTDATTRAIHAETYGRYRATLERFIGAALAADGRPALRGRVAHLAIGVSALLDGLWLEWCLDPTAFTARDGETIALEFVSAATGLALRSR
jgi:AcrR family transcriptional regulator